MASCVCLYVYMCFVFIQAQLGDKNSDKTNLIRFRPHSLSINNYFNVHVAGKIVSETHLVKYLGIILQSNLCWDLHINAVKKRQLGYYSS